MKANTRNSGISFVRFVAALVGLLLGGPGAIYGDEKTSPKLKKSAAASAALALLLLAAIALWPAPVLAQTVQVTPQTGPALNITSVPVNTGPSDNYYPHVDGNWVAYTSDLDIRYYDLLTGTDAGIPRGASLQDLLSDVEGGRIVYSRVLRDGTVSVNLFDIASGTQTEIDPQVGVVRFGATIGGNTIAYIDSTVAVGGELMVYDLWTGTVTRLTNDKEIDQNPRLSPDGNTLVWEHCQSSGTLCDIWQTVKSNGTWTVSVASNDPSHEEYPDTNGSLIVYDSDRPSGAADIFFRAVSGAAEAEVALPGIQINPKMAGNLVVFESRDGTLGDIFLYDIAQNQLYNLTNTPSLNEELDSISVLPSGEIVVVYDSDEAGPIQRHVHALRFALPPSSPPQMPGMATHVNPPLRSATFEFTLPPISRGNVTFLCSLDHAPFIACASPVVFQGLVPGPHTFQVAAQDINHNIGFPAISTFTISSSPSAPLTITANNATQTYGTAAPAFGVTYSGFVNSDTPASLGGTLLCITAATQVSPVGSYPITCAGLTSTTYAITYAPGTLTITPAPLSVVANSVSRPYGANNPVLTGTVTGLQNGDPITASFTTTAGPASFVGSYLITGVVYDPSNRLGNYALSLSNGMLSVVPETTSLSVTLSPLSILVGQSSLATVTLTAPDMVIPIDPSVLAPMTLSSPVVSDILSNNGLCTPVPSAGPGVASCIFSVTSVEPNGRTLNASFPGTADLAASSATGDLTVTAALESQKSCINSDFRNVAVPGGGYLWFNSIFRVRDVGKQKINISFFQSSVQFQYKDANKNVVTVNQPMPDAEIVIDPSVTTASTTFDAVDNVWITTIPFDLDDNAFLTGMPWLVPAGGLPGDIEPVSWCGTFASDTAGVDIGWRWAAAAYSSFSSDNSVLGVKPMDTDHDNASSNHDRAGTPENFKTFVIPGARGKGGKNYTGTYSRSAVIE